jgi:hypothetical protein
MPASEPARDHGLMTEASPHGRPRRLDRLFPCLAIGLACLYCHGFLLTNDGLYWDGWYVFDWVKTRNWTMLHHFYDSLGLPFFELIYRIFAFAPALIATFMWATVLCFFASGMLTFHLALKLVHLTRGEALALALLTVVLPYFTAAQDFIMFPFIFTHTLFLFAAWLIAEAFKTSGPRQWFLRFFGVAAFVLSFSNAALLVYYGGFYILFFFSYRRLSQLPLFTAAWRFVRRFPELLVLPPVTWYARSVLTPQYGWYARYNEPQLGQVIPNVESFFRYVPAYPFKIGTAWISAHPFVVGAMLLAAAVWYLLGAKDWRFKRSSISSVHFLWFGAVLLVFAVIPFAAAGKAFWPRPIGEISRHCILVPLPMAILVFALFRLVFTWRTDATSRLFWPVIACLLIVLGVQSTRVYLIERAEWIHSRSFLYHAVRNEDVRNSSVIFARGDFSFLKEIVYGLYGFKIALGSMDRFITNRVPANGTSFTPAEVDNLLISTSMLSSEYKNINRSGRQIRLEATPTGGATDWEIVRRYLQLLYFGDRKQMESFLAPLCTLKTTPLPPP